MEYLLVYGALPWKEKIPAESDKEAGHQAQEFLKRKLREGGYDVYSCGAVLYKPLRDW